MYVASSGEPLLSLFKGQKWPSLGGHMFYLDSYKEKLRFYILLILST